MIETKLYQAAQALPEPSGGFAQIEEKAYCIKRKPSFSVRHYRRLAAVLACTVLLLGGAAAAATTEVDYSAWASRSNDFSHAEKIADQLGVILPETLDGSPFYNITTMYVVPEGTTYLEALTNPAYPWYSVVYDEYSISFGSTGNELFQYVFSLDESGTRILEDVLPGSYRTEVYHGVTMQIVTDIQYDGENEHELFAYHHRVIWVDTNIQAVFSLHKSSYAGEERADRIPDEMIAFAKEIIGLNRSEG